MNPRINRLNPIIPVVANIVSRLVSKPEALWVLIFLIDSKLLYPKPITGDFENKFNPSLRFTNFALMDDVRSSFVPSPGGLGNKNIVPKIKHKPNIKILIFFNL